MNALLERAVTIESETLPNPAEIAGTETLDGLSNFTVQNLGGGALALTEESLATHLQGTTDEHGNITPVQGDLREVEEWILEPGHTIKTFTKRDVLEAVVETYRKIPRDIRAYWSDGQHTSDVAITDLDAGHGLKSFVSHVIPHGIPGIYDPSHNGTWR